MMNWLTNRHFIFLIRLVIGVVFVYAAIDKIAHPDQFARIVYNYHILPGWIINFFALFLPWLEVLCGVMLITGFWHKSATVILAGMTIVFIAALSIALIRGVNIECGCFSTAPKTKKPVMDLIIRDIFIVIGCWLILLARKSFLSLTKVSR